MTGKILVTFATRAGSTAEMAEAIAGRLCETGLETNVLAVGDPAAVAERKKHTEKARTIVAPVVKAFFEGMIDPARLSFFNRLAVRLVKSPLGDRRDWPRIEAWAAALAPRLIT